MSLLNAIIGGFLIAFGARALVIYIDEWLAARRARR
jgi:hypothetical protein